MEVREPYSLDLQAVQRTELGELPSDWKVVPLDEFDPFVTSGSRGWAAYYSDVGSNFLRITNLSRTCIYPSLNDLRYVAVPPDNREGIRTALEIGDILISITADIGIVGLVTAEINLPAYINQHIALVRFADQEVNSRYLAYFLSGASSQRRFESMTDAGAKAGMNLSGVRNILAAFPPTTREQEAIAEALADTDALVKSLEQLLIKKRQIKQGAMQELLTGKRRLPGFSTRTFKQGDSQSTDWISQSIDEIAEVKTGPFGSALHERDYVQSGIPIITVEHLAERGIQGEEAPQVGEKDVLRLQAYKLEEGDIVFSRVGSIDRNARVSAAEEGWLFSGRLLRLRLKSSEVDSQFLSYLFHGAPFKNQVERVAVGQTMASLNTKLLSGLKVVLPRAAEQKAIAKSLAAMDTDIAVLEARLTKARSLKQAMAQSLLTGRIRLTEPTA